VHVQDKTLTPILWPDELRDVELRGSSTLAAARDREAALRREWAGVAADADAAPLLATPGATERAFMEAFSVVLAHALYLPSAGCFALVPLASFMGRTGAGNGCEVDYDTGASMTHAACSSHT
jgi:protein-histidine N-methyltransferase